MLILKTKSGERKDYKKGDKKLIEDLSYRLSIPVIKLQLLSSELVSLRRALVSSASKGGGDTFRRGAID